MTLTESMTLPRSSPRGAPHCARWCEGTLRLTAVGHWQGIEPGGLKVESEWRPLLGRRRDQRDL